VSTIFLNKMAAGKLRLEKLIIVHGVTIRSMRKFPTTYRWKTRKIDKNL